jgi:hypothetical protein
MNRSTYAVVVLMVILHLAGMPTFAAEIGITGTVQDPAGKPLAGVNVSVLSDPAIKAVTADDGSFQLMGSYTPKLRSSETLSPVYYKMLTGKVSVTAAKAGLLSTRVLSKESANGVQLTMYPEPTGNVTFIGNLLGPAHLRGLTKEAIADHGVFMLAFDGHPGIKAEFDQILKDYWPEGGALDGDAALELEDQFTQRLTYYLDGDKQNEIWGKVKNHPYDNAATVTGEIHADKDGKDNHWISVSQFGSTTIKHPEKMVTPYKPFLMPSKPPLEIKLNDTASIKLIYIAPGRFYMGCPLYQIPHWEEAPQHMVNLSKGYYLAETPLTYEQYAALTGDTAAGEGKKPDSAAGLSCAMFLKFCKMLSEKTGKKVRPPTAAEWEYAARAGTSNPSCAPEGKGRGITFPVDPPVENDAFASVKNTQPNAWGFYQMMVKGSSERTSDNEASSATAHGEVTDPSYPVKEDANPETCRGGQNQMQHCCKGSEGFPIMEMMRSGGGRGKPFEPEWNNMAKRERIVIEDDAPTTPAK